jgi:hypothetical protein
MFRRESYLWEDVARFGVVLVGHRRKVGFHYAHTTAMSSPFRAAVTTQLGGYEAALPSTFGMDPEDLALLMNEWRGRSVQEPY